MSPVEEKSYVRPLPGPLPFPMEAIKILSNVELSPAQYKQIALLNLTYFKSVAELEIKYIKNLSGIIDDLGLKG